MRSAGLVLVLPLLGCVYPATEPTGIELSWRFLEHNEADGEDARRVRSCAGADTEQVAVEITDQADPRRSSIFRFDCAEGYQTTVDLQTEASDAFVRLNPGTYTMAISAVDDANNAPVAEQLQSREVTIEERGVTVAPWELSRAPVPWSLELTGLDACGGVTLALHYGAPERDLPDHVPDEEDSPRLYRAALTSDRGLAVGGQTTACSADLAGTHRFDAMDRGEYRLEITVDGRRCPLPVDLRIPQGGGNTIDLAKLPCDG